MVREILVCILLTSCSFLFITVGIKFIQDFTYDRRAWNERDDEEAQP